MCQKMFQRLFVKSWAGLEPGVSVKTLTIIDGILGMTHAAKQECDDGTWILADTVATREPVGVMKEQKIPASTQPCELAAGQLVMLRDGPVLMDWLIL